MPSSNVPAGFIDEFKFPKATRGNLLERLGGGDCAEKMLSCAETCVAQENFIKKIDRGEPDTRAALRKELSALADFFATVSSRCEAITRSASASIRSQGGASGSQFEAIAKYFLEQSGAARRAATVLPSKRGRERKSNRYMFTLTNLARCYRELFKIDMKTSRGSPGYELARATLEACRVGHDGKGVEGGYLEKLLTEAVRST